MKQDSDTSTTWVALKNIMLREKEPDTKAPLCDGRAKAGLRGQKSDQWLPGGREGD